MPPLKNVKLYVWQGTKNKKGIVLTLDSTSSSVVVSASESVRLPVV